ncbi:hypothetical protein AHMF7605_29275 [Adhaeribacter arboris]|uniref:histidine kinase n=1 Tax=Adhaeribacter arboris TaxID=2072846 RepID=A0A2T2Y8Z7_9BACT|nr:hypothetical protein AHMF7605_29275 [Adhaeribacter arboris]
MPAEKLPSIFERFFQVNGDQADNSSKGTGIGLSLVKELVELQRGRLPWKVSPEKERSSGLAAAPTGSGISTRKGGRTLALRQWAYRCRPS